MARLPAFQRMGGAVADATGGDADGAPDEAGDGGPEYGPDANISPPDKQHDEAEIAVCPNCGCAFNDETGEILGKDHPQYPGAGGDESGEGPPEQGGTP